MGFAAHHRKGERVGQAGAVGQPGRAWASLTLLSSSGSASAGMAWGGAEARRLRPLSAPSSGGPGEALCPQTKVLWAVFSVSAQSAFPARWEAHRPAAGARLFIRMFSHLVCICLGPSFVGTAIHLGNMGIYL